MLAGSLIGRTGEVGELVTAWARLSGRPRVVLITGDPGVGKTALVSTAISALAAGRVLTGRARLHSPAPYDWLAAVLSSRELTDLPGPREAVAWLAQQPEVPAERFAPGALLRVAVRVVRHLVGPGPAVLVAEDLHALDPASLSLLAELAHCPALPALLVVTSRPTDDPQALLTLAQLGAATDAVRLHLGPLPAQQVRELVSRVRPEAAPGLAEALWQHSGGNPYTLTELLARVNPAGPGTVAPELATRPGPDAELTGRERQVLACLAAGMSNKQVARALEISIRTVAVHVSNVLRKTGSSSRTEAALWAVRAGRQVADA
jgi:DNA-binding NarL/FixJ family response regulator